MEGLELGMEGHTRGWCNFRPTAKRAKCQLEELSLCLQGEPLGIFQQEGGRGHKGNWLGRAGWSGGESGRVGSTAIALGPAEDCGPGRGDTEESYLRKWKQ